MTETFRKILQLLWQPARFVTEFLLCLLASSILCSIAGLHLAERVGHARKVITLLLQLCLSILLFRTGQLTGRPACA